MKKIVVFTIMILGVCSCNARKDLARLISNLKSENDSIRFKAIDALDNVTPNLKQQIMLLKEASAKFPKARYEWQSIPSLLVETATKSQAPSLVDAIKENYSNYDRNAKSAALNFLSKYPDKKAIQTYMELLLMSPNEINYLPKGILGTDFAFKDIIFPKLLTLLDTVNLQNDILLLLLDHFDAKQLNPKDYEQYCDQILNLSKKSRALILKEEALQKDIWDDDVYQTERENAGVYADILGYFNTEQAIAELNEYLALKDCKVKMFAAISLLQLNQQVDASVINIIAEDAESRQWLYDDLVSIKKENLFPPKYKTQEAFAESNMVNWLIYPTELGRTPDSIQLMKVVAIDSHSEDGTVEFYLFRFKSDHDTWKESGWMTGVSGYFAQKDKPTTNASGYTFSSFEKWDSKSPDEHIQDIRNIIDEQNKQK